MNSQLKISLRPNNQITLTRGRWRKKELPVSQNIQHDFEKISFPRILEKKDEIVGNRLYYQDVISKAKTLSTEKLDIIKKSQRSKKAPSSKLNTPKNFTRQSGQKLRECGAAIDIACEQNTRFCHEVTLTLPANTHEAFTAIAAYTGYAINRLFEPIRKKYGEMCLWFFVWEYQKRGALHLHICVYHPDESEGLYIASQLILHWHKILCDISIRANTCMFSRKNKKSCVHIYKHQHHTAPIKKAVGAYFSKYAGKQESKKNWYCKKYPVSRFWGSCYALKAIIKRYSIEFNFDYQGSEKDALEKFESIVQNVIEKLKIVSTSSYQFNIFIQGKSRLNRYQNGRKILVIDDDKCLASGERFTFYIGRSELNNALELIKSECEFF